ncbi:PREDICTED: uncharacterized protein LOC105555680 [Vollenhovia emeryi]|uniref:uncharacterized protein LOC105555680 n=1 Tax=Vollenhovia emeryi TaxID=411798 RepID=UPI0005F541B4|nr:PREDICTED: uncharacterized protein LOC105555680 [Vollenhovia emeryi]
MIAQTIEKSQKRWDRFIPEIAYAYNTAHCESTGYTPAYLNFGRELRPSGSVGQITVNTEKEDPETRIKQLREALELAKVKLAQIFQRQQHHYNLRRRDWRPRIGEEVWKRTHELSSKAEAFNAKLAAKFEGPFIVHRVRSPVVFDLKTIDGKNTVSRVHVRDLKSNQTR